MIVIHPKDKTTSFLKAIYAGKRDVTLIDETWNNRNIREAIGSAPKKEPIMMLGHGYNRGLFAPFDGNPFARTIVDDRLVYLLKEHTCIGIWCYANEFAENHELKGLFTGMIISEQSEADQLGVDIIGENLQLCNNQFASDLEYCMRRYSLELVPKMMQELQDYHSDLKDFNYKNLYYYG
jgi:hypothetical protein